MGANPTYEQTAFLTCALALYKVKISKLKNTFKGGKTMQTYTYLNSHYLHRGNLAESMNLQFSSNYQVRLNLGIVFPYERASFRQNSH